MIDPIERAMVEAACRVFRRRAAALRIQASKLTTSTMDARGRTVTILSPEATTALAAADLFTLCAADIDGGSP